MTDTNDIRDRAFAAMDAAEEALTWTTSRGTWEAVREYMSGRRGLIKHRPTGDELGEFVHPADAEHAALWHPRRILALITRDRATLKQHSPSPTSDDSCPCGWEYDHCPEANAVIEFWLASEHPDIVRRFDEGNVVEVLLDAFPDASMAELQAGELRIMALITGKDDGDTREMVGMETASINPAVIGNDLIYLLGEHPDIDLTTVRFLPGPHNDHVLIEARRGEAS